MVKKNIDLFSRKLYEKLDKDYLLSIFLDISLLTM